MNERNDVCFLEMIDSILAKKVLYGKPFSWETYFVALYAFRDAFILFCRRAITSTRDGSEY